MNRPDAGVIFYNGLCCWKYKGLCRYRCVTVNIKCQYVDSFVVNYRKVTVDEIIKLSIQLSHNGLCHCHHITVFAVAKMALFLYNFDGPSSGVLTCVYRDWVSIKHIQILGNPTLKNRVYLSAMILIKGG